MRSIWIYSKIGLYRGATIGIVWGLTKGGLILLLCYRNPIDRNPTIKEILGNSYSNILNAPFIYLLLGELLSLCEHIIELLLLGALIGIFTEMLLKFVVNPKDGKLNPLLWGVILGTFIFLLKGERWTKIIVKGILSLPYNWFFLIPIYCSIILLATLSIYLSNKVVRKYYVRIWANKNSQIFDL